MKSRTVFAVTIAIAALLVAATPGGAADSLPQVDAPGIVQALQAIVAEVVHSHICQDPNGPCPTWLVCVVDAVTSWNPSSPPDDLVPSVVGCTPGEFCVEFVRAPLVIPPPPPIPRWKSIKASDGYGVAFRQHAPWPGNDDPPQLPSDIGYYRLGIDVDPNGQSCEG